MYITNIFNLKCYKFKHYFINLQVFDEYLTITSRSVQSIGFSFNDNRCNSYLNFILVEPNLSFYPNHHDQ